MRQKKVLLLFLLAVFLIGLSSVSGSVQAEDLREAIVKVYVVNNSPDYYNPWNMRGPRNRTGSGAIISDGQILTNAHVVSDATFIQVRRYGETRRYAAQVKSVSHQSDLALLEVHDPIFFKGVKPLEFGELPESHQEVSVYGFPIGGDMLSITKGVVSRIEHQPYVHSSSNLLAAQIDAAINPGNSGGPVIVDGKIVGVAMQAIPQAQNIGYMIPVTVIEHFVSGQKTGEYRGFPSLGIIMQRMENPHIRQYYKMAEDQTGMLITNIFPGSSSEGVVLPGDILVRVDDYSVANDGTVEFRPNERTGVAYAVQKYQIGEKVEVEILRDGELLTLEITLHRPATENWLVPMEQYDILPTYYIYGGFVFSPLTKDLLKIWGESWEKAAPIELIARYKDNMPRVEGEEVVVITRVLASDVNEGYQHLSFWVVDTVNGQQVKNMRELVRIIDNNPDPFTILENRQGQRVVLDHEQVLTYHDAILSTYRINQDRSEDLIQW